VYYLANKPCLRDLDCCDLVFVSVTDRIYFNDRKNYVNSVIMSENIDYIEYCYGKF